MIPVTAAMAVHHCHVDSELGISVDDAVKPGKG